MKSLGLGLNGHKVIIRDVAIKLITLGVAAAFMWILNGIGNDVEHGNEHHHTEEAPIGHQGPPVN